MARLIAAVDPAPSVDGRGRRLVANRSCRKGEALIREVPILLWGPDARAEVASSTNGKALLGIVDSLGAGGEDTIAAFLALARVPGPSRAQVLNLAGYDSLQAELAGNILANLHAPLPSEFDEATQRRDCAALAGVVPANAALNEDGRRAIYVTLSMANHACEPNAAWHTHNHHTGEKDLVCIKPITEGEEVCISYLAERDLFELDVVRRRARLQDIRGFECQCARCCIGVDNNAARDAKLLDLTTALRSMGDSGHQQTKEEVVQYMKQVGAKLRQLDTLWPGASALKASLWHAYARLLARYGAPEQLKHGAARRALEESRPCVSDKVWVEQASALQAVIDPSAQPSSASTS